MNSRSEPLLWLQLVGLAAIPLELLLVLVLLAGSDPGRFPLLEWLLAWGLGAVAPAVLFWLKPPDPFSLLLLQAPASSRRAGQIALATIPLGLPLKLLLASGALLLLPLLLWLDRTSVLATSFALVPNSNRIYALLLSAPVLTLMMWQWHQLVQATWLLGSQPSGPANPAGNGQQRLSLGLPLLSLPTIELNAEPEIADDPELAADPVAVEPEETAEEAESPDLDQPIS